MKEIKKIRSLLKSHKIDGYIIPKNDEFLSEYVPEIKDNLKFVSKFYGSYGFELILKKKTTCL